MPPIKPNPGAVTSTWAASVLFIETSTVRSVSGDANGSDLAHEQSIMAVSAIPTVARILAARLVRDAVECSLTMFRHAPFPAGMAAGSNSPHDVHRAAILQ